MKIIKCVFFMILALSVQACSSMDKSMANQWWSDNNEIAKEIVRIIEDDPNINLVDTSDEGKFESEAYTRLFELLIKIDQKKISVLRYDDIRSTIKNVRFVVYSSGFSTDGCGLAVEYIDSHDYLNNLKNHAAHIEGITDTQKWFIVVYGDKDRCLLD